MVQVKVDQCVEQHNQASTKYYSSGIERNSSVFLPIGTLHGQGGDFSAACGKNFRVALSGERTLVVSLEYTGAERAHIFLLLAHWHVSCTKKKQGGIPESFFGCVLHRIVQFHGTSCTIVHLRLPGCGMWI